VLGTDTSALAALVVPASGGEGYEGKAGVAVEWVLSVSFCVWEDWGGMERKERTEEGGRREKGNGMLEATELDERGVG
jgi:hypothetical protein